MSSRPHALVVDDDALVRQYMRDVLVAEGWSVTEAADGVEALHAYRVGGFRLVVLDMVMPNLGGLEVVRAIRAIDLQVPVLLVSGNTGPGTIEAGIALGRCRFLAKPFRAAALLTAIDTVMSDLWPELSESP
jgi:two-component system OmpR family response regulator